MPCTRARRASIDEVLDRLKLKDSCGEALGAKRYDLEALWDAVQSPAFRLTPEILARECGIECADARRILVEIEKYITAKTSA